MKRYEFQLVTNLTGELRKKKKEKLVCVVCVCDEL